MNNKTKAQKKRSKRKAYLKRKRQKQKQLKSNKKSQPMYNASEKLKIQNKISPPLPEIQSMKHFVLKNAIEQCPCSGRNSLQFDYYIQEHTREVQSVFLIGKAELNGDVVVTHTGIYQSKTTGAELLFFFWWFRGSWFSSKKKEGKKSAVFWKKKREKSTLCLQCKNIILFIFLTEAHTFLVINFPLLSS